MLFCSVRFFQSLGELCIAEANVQEFEHVCFITKCHKMSQNVTIGSLQGRLSRRLIFSCTVTSPSFAHPYRQIVSTIILREIKLSMHNSPSVLFYLLCIVLGNCFNADTQYLWNFNLHRCIRMWLSTRSEFMVPDKATGPMLLCHWF